MHACINCATDSSSDGLIDIFVIFCLLQLDKKAIKRSTSAPHSDQENTVDNGPTKLHITKHTDENKENSHAQETRHRSPSAPASSNPDKSTRTPLQETNSVAVNQGSNNAQTAKSQSQATDQGARTPGPALARKVAFIQAPESPEDYSEDIVTPLPGRGQMQSRRSSRRWRQSVRKASHTYVDLALPITAWYARLVQLPAPTTPRTSFREALGEDDADSKCSFRYLISRDFYTLQTQVSKCRLCQHHC